MRRVILARHGTHDEVGHVLSGRSEIGLNAGGRGEAAALARAVADRSIASLHASPRRRTMETAEPVAAVLRLPVRVSLALDEIDFGAFTGRSFAALEGDTAWHRWNAERDTARCPGGETMAEAVGRALDYIAALPTSHFPALCVTHCDIIRGIVAHGLGLDYSAMFSLDCAPGSRTEIDLAHGFRLIALNSV